MKKQQNSEDYCVEKFKCGSTITCGINVCSTVVGIAEVKIDQKTKKNVMPARDPVYMRWLNLKKLSLNGIWET